MEPAGVEAAVEPAGVEAAEAVQPPEPKVDQQSAGADEGAKAGDNKGGQDDAGEGAGKDGAGEQPSDKEKVNKQYNNQMLYLLIFC